jgi:hypothetical protein
MARFDPDLPDPLPKGGFNRTLKLVLAVAVLLLVLGFLFGGPRFGGSPLGPPPVPSLPN